MSSPASDRPFFSVLIPAHNEEGSIVGTCEAIIREFGGEGISDYEILVVNDNSSDSTGAKLAELSQRHSCVRHLDSQAPNGFGFALREGLGDFRGEAVCIVMGDMSDSPADIVEYYRRIENGAECVFGSRFIKGAKVVDYPPHKLLLNRLANLFVRILFGLRHNDITNAFKCYRKEVIEGVQPLLSPHFNLTVELPLKAIVRGYHYDTVPISWTGRKSGVSKLRIKEMGSRYLFIVLYVLLEKLLSRGDYRRTDGDETRA